jgi:folate-dependent phosphoribosylglycinamide formyltransferase PurN
VVLGGPSESTWIVTNALAREFGDVTLVLEELVPTADFLKRRVRKLGIVTVAGQLAFMAGWLPLLRRRSRARLAAIRAANGLDASFPSTAVARVDSVNGERVRAELRRIAPAAVVVNGTRIIGRETLATAAALGVPMINMHAGITPLYRGVHGAYWALREGRGDLAGVTVHLIDAGIDTGAVIDQATIAVTPEDSFVTYPLIQTAAGLPLLATAVRRALEGTLAPRPAPPLASRLRTHPTLWSYAAGRLLRGVR